MASAMVRINPETHAKLKELSEHFGEPMPAVLDKAIEAFRRQTFLKKLAGDFATLRGDERAWAEEVAERKAWDNTLMDGLEDD
jgi:predicted transcriptional regulator